MERVLVKKRVLGIFLLLLGFFVLGCPNSAGPTIVCDYGDLNEILPSILKLDASGTLPFDEGKGALTGFVFKIEKPDGGIEYINSENGIIEYEFGKEGKYTVTIVSADDSGVKNSNDFFFDIIVLNPFLGLSFNSNLQKTYIEGTTPLFSISMLAGYDTVASLVDGVEWILSNLETGEELEKGTGVEWSSDKFDDINSEPGKDDHGLSVFLVDKYGNNHILSSSFNVVSKESPVLDFVITHYSVPTDSTSLLERIVPILNPSSSQPILYEYETIIIDASELKASGIGDPSVFITNYSWILEKKVEADYIRVDSIETETDSSGFVFIVDESGAWRVLGGVKNNLGLEISESIEFTVTANIPVINSLSFSEGVYEGGEATLNLNATSPCGIDGEVTFVSIDFVDDRYTDLRLPLTVADDGSSSVSWITDSIFASTFDNVCLVNLSVENKAGNSSVVESTTFIVKDNNPVATIGLKADTVFYGSLVELDLSSCKSPDPSEVAQVSVEVSLNGTLIDLDGGNFFTPVDPDPDTVGDILIYTITSKVTNRVGTASVSTSLTAIEPILLASFFAEYQNGKSDYFANQRLLLNATNSIDGSKPIHEAISDANYIWTVTKDDVAYASGAIGSFSDENLLRATPTKDVGTAENGLFYLQLSDVGIYRVSLSVKDSVGAFSVDNCDRSLVVLDNTPKNIVVMELPNDVVHESLTSPVTKEKEYTFSVMAESPDGSVITDFYWFNEKNVDSNNDFGNADAEGSTISFSYGDAVEHFVSVVARNSAGSASILPYLFTSVDFTPPSVSANRESINVEGASGLKLLCSPSKDGVIAYRYAFESDLQGVVQWFPSAEGVLETEFFVGSHFDGKVEGDYHFFVQEKKAGLWSNSGSVMVKFDLTPPNKPVITRHEEFTNDGRLAGIWTWTPEVGNEADVSSYEYTADSTADSVVWEATEDLSPFFSNIVVESNEEREVSLSLRAIDKAGNKSQIASSLVFVDRIAPQSPVNSIAMPTEPYVNASIITGVTEYRWEHPDMDDVHEFVGVLTRDTTAEAEISFGKELAWIPSAEMAEGNNILSVIAVDLAGNRSLECDILVIRDTVPPSAPIITRAFEGNIYEDPATNVVYAVDTTPGWTWAMPEGADAIDSLYGMAVSGAEPAEWIVGSIAGNFTSSLLSEEKGYVMHVKVQDMAGNWTVATSAYTLDITPPVISLSATDATIDRRFNTDFTALASYTLPDVPTAADSGSGVNVALTAIALHPSLDKGTFTSQPGIVYSFKDNLGNKSEDTRNVKITPLAFVWDNPGFESNTAGVGGAGGLLPNTAETAGWFMEDVSRGQATANPREAWLYPVTVYDSSSFDAFQYVDDATCFVFGGYATNNGSDPTSTISFMSQGYRVVYENTVWFQTTHRRHHFSSGKLVYGGGTVGDVTFDRDCWVYKDVAYEIKGWIYYTNGMNGDNSQPIQFRVEKRDKTAVGGGSSPKWTALEVGSAGEWHMNKSLVTFTPTEDMNIRFVLEIFGGTGGSSYYFDNFSIGITDYVGKVQ